MKKSITWISLAVAVLLAGGCEYESPLETEHTLPIDSALPGLWVPAPEPGEKADADETMLVLRYSATEYLIHYPTGQNGIYYRGYPIQIGDISCVQLEVLGTGEGPPDGKAKGLFHVATYEIREGLLEVRLLNPDLVDPGLKEPPALRKAFLEKTGNKDLFEPNPTRFRKEET